MSAVGDVIALLAATALGLAVAMIIGGRATAHVLRMRLALAGRAAAPRSTSGVQRAHRGATSAAAMVLAAVLGAALAGATIGPAGAVAVVVAVPTARWLRRRRLREIARRRRSAAVADACLVIGSELTAGASPPGALAAAAQEWPDLFGAAAGRVGIGGDPVPALRAAAELPGAEAMTAVGAAWEVAEKSGARAAVVLRVVADTVRDEAAVRHEAAAQLATVRTTARMLAALPPITLVIFSGGVEPVRFLVRNPYGLACLGGATVLLALGLAWVAVVRREATRSAWHQ